MRIGVSAEIWWLQVADWQPKINSIVEWCGLGMHTHPSCCIITAAHNIACCACRFGQLQAVDVSGVPPAIHTVQEGNVLRPDTPAAFPERCGVWTHISCWHMTAVGLAPVSQVACQQLQH